jgi:hypothetical protein
MFGSFLGFSWLFSKTLGYGPPAVYVGVFLAYAWMALVVLWGFVATDWATRATTLMAERKRTPETDSPD